MKVKHRPRMIILLHFFKPKICCVTLTQRLCHGWLMMSLMTHFDVVLRGFQ